MPFRSGDDPVESILKQEFPGFMWAMHSPPITLHSAPESPDSRARRQELRKKIEQREQELKALKITDTTAFWRIHTEAQAKANEAARVAADARERSMFYNLPTANADFDHWGKMAYWSLDEGIALCFGKDPRAVNWGMVNPYVNVSPFAKQFADAREIASRAALVNEIAQSNIPGPFIAWAKRVGLPLPAELETKVAERGPIVDWRTVFEQEHTAHAATVQEANTRIAKLEREAAEAKDAAAHRWPWGSYETNLLQKLDEAVKRFWVGYDPADPSTANTNDTVKDWLKQQGVSDRVAEVMAQIIRADGLRTGPR